MAKAFNTRAAAAQVLVQVIQGRSFSPQIISELFKFSKPEDKSFIAHLCFGVLRFYHRLNGWAQQLIAQPLKKKDQDLHCLVLVGLYQLYYTDIPTYAVLHNTVEGTIHLKKNWAKKLINGVLRKAAALSLSATHETTLEITSAHPRWLVQALQKAWPQHWEQIIDANLQPPPFSLRVNNRKISTHDYLQQLKSQQLSAEPIAYCPQGIFLAQGIDVNELPGFQAGWISVQDGAGQLAAALLDLRTHQRLLDACAAPGSKTAHILETESTVSLLALDNDPQRIALLKSTLNRLQLKAEIACFDATQPQDWWDGQLFDRILLDAPCSATGVIRRHPDIKLHRQPSDLPALMAKQALLLEKLWPLLKPGGILLYATCSILPEENVDQIASFLAQHPDAQEWPIVADWGIAQTVGRQILPGQHHMDGFYYARLQKVNNG